MAESMQGGTLIVFSDKPLAEGYILHRMRTGPPSPHCLVVLVEDTRAESGLCVVWRDPIPFGELAERQANCRWMLERTLAGSYARSAPGAVKVVVRGGKEA